VFEVDVRAFRPKLFAKRIPGNQLAWTPQQPGKDARRLPFQAYLSPVLAQFTRMRVENEMTESETTPHFSDNSAQVLTGTKVYRVT
jgi:hypothetical protein